jgi:hypothetical protein
MSFLYQFTQVINLDMALGVLFTTMSSIQSGATEIARATTVARSFTFHIKTHLKIIICFFFFQIMRVTCIK